MVFQRVVSTWQDVSAHAHDHRVAKEVEHHKLFLCDWSGYNDVFLFIIGFFLKRAGLFGADTGRSISLITHIIFPWVW